MSEVKKVVLACRSSSQISRETNYSKDKNLWHLSHEGLDLEDPGNEPQYDKAGFLKLGVSPKTAPDKSEFVELGFEQGVPVALNGEKLKPAAIIAKLNEDRRPQRHRPVRCSGEPSCGHEEPRRL